MTYKSMDIKNNIERGVYLEAVILAEFSTGGETFKQKTKSARKKNFLKKFGSKDKTNFAPEELIILS